MLHRRGRDDDVTLKEFMLDKFASQDRAVGAALAAADRAVAAALVAADKAAATLAVATEKRLDNVNEFRESLADQAATAMPRAEYEAMHKAFVDRVENLDRRKEEEIGRVLALHTALELRVSSRLDVTSGEGHGAETARAALAAAAAVRSRTLSIVIAAVSTILVGMGIAVTIIIAAIHGGG